MPFTPAHAIAALPFQRSRLNTSALVIGCMSPDFEYFLRLSATGHLGHTIPGIFLFDLPLALIVFWLFHRYTRCALDAAAPGMFPIGQAPEASVFPRTTQHSLVALSIVLGATTHILWDAFTHPTFWPYRHIPFLSKKIALPPVGTFECFQFLQYGSSLLGMTVLAILWSRWLRSPYAPHPVQLRRSGMLLLLTAAVGAVLRVLLGARVHPLRTVEVGIAQAVVTFMALLWLGLVCYGVALRRTPAQAHPAPS